MLKKFLPVFGIFIFISGIYLLNNLAKSEENAKKRDDEKKGYGIISGEFLPCNWEATAPERVIAEDKSAAVLIKVINKTNEKCDLVLSLRAPGFDASPMKEEQSISLPANKSGSVSWIITPRKTGSYQIAVSDSLDTKIFGVTVKNIYGLSTIQAKFLSILGSIFGPMFTLPWWWDRLKNRKKDNPQNIAKEISGAN